MVLLLRLEQSLEGIELCLKTTVLCEEQFRIKSGSLEGLVLDEKPLTRVSAPELRGLTLGTRTREVRAPPRP